MKRTAEMDTTCTLLPSLRARLREYVPDIDDDCLPKKTLEEFRLESGKTLQLLEALLWQGYCAGNAVLYFKVLACMTRCILTKEAGVNGRVIYLHGSRNCNTDLFRFILQRMDAISLEMGTFLVRSSTRIVCVNRTMKTWSLIPFIGTMHEKETNGVHLTLITDNTGTIDRSVYHHGRVIDLHPVPIYYDGDSYSMQCDEEIAQKMAENLGDVLRRKLMCYDNISRFLSYLYIFAREHTDIVSSTYCT